MRTAAARVLRELLWWLFLSWRALSRFPGPVLVLLAVAWFVGPALPLSLVVVLLLLVLALRVAALLWPAGFHRRLVAPAVGHVHRRRMRRHWPSAAAACGLGVTTNLGRAGQPGMDAFAVPRLLRSRVDGMRVQLRVRLLMGQTVEHVEKAADALRSALAASHVRVDGHLANEVRLTFTVGDVLTAAFSARTPQPAVTEAPRRVVMGRLEDGTTWHLPVGPHTLVAGCSGAGKGSVFWSYAFGLAPAAHAGRVQLHGIDLKGGMEILMGSGLFTSAATTAAEAVASLEALVEQMRERTKRYAGRIRSHTATVDEPLHVVMIDELAVLTAYQPERDLQRRAEMAINLLCSQGRAVGFVVFACLQDPRKEVIPSRGLFTQMVGLRLKDVSETAMVLGELAVASGAHCHRITRTTPGMGYVLPEEGGHPVRVRAGYVSDAEIRRVAAAYPAPARHDVRPAEGLTPSLPSARSSRPARREGAA